MSQYHIFDAIQAANVTVTLKGSSVAVRPSKNVSQALACFIRANKTELLDMLRRSADLRPCQRCQGPQMAVGTFDGFENFECMRCGVCSGCRPIGNQLKFSRRRENSKLCVCSGCRPIGNQLSQELSSGGASA